jgi:hypothetical protein
MLRQTSRYLKETKITSAIIQSMMLGIIPLIIIINRSRLGLSEVQMTMLMVELVKKMKTVAISEVASSHTV